MNAAEAIPGWLSAAGSVQYLSFVLRSLTEREAIRDNARALSRRHVSSPNRRGMSFNPTQRKGLHVHYSVSVGCQPENALRNRYYQLEPYDRSRVVVVAGQGSERRYVNASWILERAGHKWWIATQAPLPSTAHAFLSLIAQPSARLATGFEIQIDPQAQSPFLSRVRTVVQLTQNFEGGRRKAHAYFPSDIGKSLVITPEEGCTTPAFQVTLLESRSFPEAHCIQSTVSVVPVDAASEGTSKPDDGENDSRQVVFRHMLYTSWPDHGVPSREDQASIIAFAQLVDAVNRDTQSGDANDSDPPVIVGCSAGVGRTGSFIALSSLLRSLGRLPDASFPMSISSLPPSPLGPLPTRLADDLVAQEVDFLREQRPRMVERDEQVLFIYEALASALGAT
ncbi:hypothetical protein APHAL10511_005983 [Amanita phalloides]|nr:hypothetical protein APHAL10511_005983 [Amanita phalloides]